MKVTPAGDAVLSEEDIFTGLYTGKITDFSSLNIDDKNAIDQFNNSIRLNADRINCLQMFSPSQLSIEDIDKERQQSWLMPESYKNFDIAGWLVEQCTSDTETNRVLEELKLFLEKDMIDVLIFLKYLVDVMRENNIVWGVGRGSSVASFCLYLIGIHKINSIQYNLDIREFLKSE